MPPKKTTSGAPRGRPPKKAGGATASKNTKSSAGGRTISSRARGSDVNQDPFRRARGHSDSDTQDDGGGEDDEDEEAQEEEQQREQAAGPSGAGDQDRDEAVEEHRENKEMYKPYIPPELLTRLVHTFFERDGTRITRDANDALAKYMHTFLNEAIARAAAEKGSGFLEVEDLEKIAPQLLLDM